ncbi:hypothetical protein BDF14DRAFT_295181 [Spinellus fusiger]|nr:hypothetical protein BDF14DRAFT_295181 [Spinellus fusiger]
MHPALILLIVAGVPLAIYYSFELYEWHSERQQQKKERKEYEEYLQLVTEKVSFHVHEEEEEEPLATTVWNHRLGQMRHRHPPSSSSSSSLSAQPPKDEFYQIEKDIHERKERLSQEKAILEQAERDLAHRKHILRQKGNSMLGLQQDTDAFDSRMFTSSMSPITNTTRSVSCDPLNKTDTEIEDPFVDPEWHRAPQLHQTYMSRMANQHLLGEMSMDGILDENEAKHKTVADDPTVDPTVDSTNSLSRTVLHTSNPLVCTLPSQSYTHLPPCHVEGPPNSTEMETSLHFPHLFPSTADGLSDTESWGDLDPTTTEHHQRLHSEASEMSHLSFNSLNTRSEGLDSYDVISVSSQDTWRH